MTTQLVENKCDGGQWSCTPPKECCKQGCCFLFSSSIFKPSSASSSFQTGTVFNPLFLGHWYFWLAVTATVAGILCACSLWRKHHQGSSWCCRDSSCRDERASEPDSNGSCYAPPQYSRCNSFHQPPPPYSEVAAKPDLYPLVISYNAEPVIKSNNGSTGYLMVQYFRNFIVRPVGSLSATSTVDSLSSSFLCNAANEANSMIPPPYSHMGSLEEITTDGGGQSQNDLQPRPSQQSLQQIAHQPFSEIARALPRSVSSQGASQYHQLLQTSRSAHTALCSAPPATCERIAPPSAPVTPRPRAPPAAATVSITDNPCFGAAQPVLDRTATQKTLARKCLERRKVSKEDSESQDDENNFSDLLNLSVCVPGAVERTETVRSGPHSQELQYSVTNSIGSDISSLANLGSPGSPPRATSPTAEMRQLLDKIQQLPQGQQEVKERQCSKGYFRKMKAKTMYMPLNGGGESTKSRNVFARGWLSRSAPCTPSAALAPSFPAHHHVKGGAKPGGGSRTNLKMKSSKAGDGSPLLLREHAEESEDEAAHKDARL